MKKFEVPYFGLVDVENLTEEQECMEINFQDKQIDLMWFPEEDVTEKYFQYAKNILEDLHKFDKESKEFLEKEFYNQEDTTVVDFLSDYLTEYDLEDEEIAEFFADIIDENATEEENLKNLLKALYLKRIAFHDDVIVADYIITDEFSNEILAISLDTTNGEKNIAWES